MRVTEPIRGSVQFTHKPHTHTAASHTRAEVSCRNGESGGKVNVFKVEVQTLPLSPLSTSVVSNSDLMKHLSAGHASAKLTLARNTIVDTADDDSRPEGCTAKPV